MLLVLSRFHHTFGIVSKLPKATFNAQHPPLPNKGTNCYSVAIPSLIADDIELEKEDRIEIDYNPVIKEIKI